MCDSFARFHAIVVLAENEYGVDEFFDRGCAVKFDPVACVKSKRRANLPNFPSATFLGGGYASDGKSILVHLLDETSAIRSVPIWRMYSLQAGVTIHKKSAKELESHIAAISAPQTKTKVKTEGSANSSNNNNNNNNEKSRSTRSKSTKKMQPDEQEEEEERIFEEGMSFHEEMNSLRSQQLENAESLRKIGSRLKAVEKKCKE
jgi:hypothetical protein